MKFKIIRTIRNKPCIGFSLEDNTISIYLNPHIDLIDQFQAANKVVADELRRRRTENEGLEAAI